MKTSFLRRGRPVILLLGLLAAGSCTGVPTDPFEDLTIPPGQAALQILADVVDEGVRVGAFRPCDPWEARRFQLDQDFEAESISSESLENALIEIGSLRAQLRYIHLEAHLQQAKFNHFASFLDDLSRTK